MGIDKSNVLRVVMVDKERMIMCARVKTTSLTIEDKTLKPGTRELPKAIKRASDTVDHVIGNRIPWR
jgi:hypothetical protein